MDYKKDKNWIALNEGENHKEYYNAINPPIISSSLHLFNNITEYYDKSKRTPHQYFYGRVDNPTTIIAEKKIAALENAKYALVFGSGMAAAHCALMHCIKYGSHIVCVKNAYGVLTYFIESYLVKKMGVTITYVDGTNTKEVIDAIQDNTDYIILESPVSVTFTVQDIRAITKVAKEKGIMTYIDNSYATPLYQNPIEMGVDIVMHTCSKYLGGHSDIIAGALVVNDEDLYEELHELRENIGGILDPHASSQLIKGIRTLKVRVQEHYRIALEVIKFLKSHPAVSKVYYPLDPDNPQYELAKSQMSGACGLLSFELKTEDKEDIVCFVDSLKVFKIGVSWGGYESLICTPMLMHTKEEASESGCGNGIMRMHCGLEGEDVLIDDLSQALKKMEERKNG